MPFEPGNLPVDFVNRSRANVVSVRFGTDGALRDYGALAPGATRTVTFEYNSADSSVFSLAAEVTWQRVDDLPVLTAQASIDFSSASRLAVTMDGPAPPPPSDNPSAEVIQADVTDLSITAQ